MSLIERGFAKFLGDHSAIAELFQWAVNLQGY